MDRKAADLPDGSIVATRNTVYIKTHPTDWSQWRGTNGGHVTDSFIDSDLADGATVLRVGCNIYGSAVTERCEGDD